MKKKDQDIWVGLAHVKNMGVNINVANGDGAETYIATRANDPEEYEAKVVAIFRQNGFQVLSLNKIEVEYDVPKDETDPVAVEKIDLFKRLGKGALFAWGNFYPYGEEEE